MNWRVASRLSVVTLALLVILVVALFSLRSISSGQSLPSNPATDGAGLQGTDLGGVPAPAFRLTDQFGKPVSLAQFRGKPVVLTFLYTHCPDVCPLIAEQLHSVMLDLGQEAQHVGVLAISVEPTRDTIAAALAFSQVHHMTCAGYIGHLFRIAGLSRAIYPFLHRLQTRSGKGKIRSRQAISCSSNDNLIFV